MLRLLSLFSGIGAFERAIENLGVALDIVNYCELDAVSAKAYSLLHEVDEGKNLGDITKVDLSTLPKDIDLVTYGFPCQDISHMGKCTGFTDSEGKRTRSGLFYNALDIIKAVKPKYAICENVKALTETMYSDELNSVLQGLEDAGYINYWQVMNALDVGVPQNRERLFIVSVRKDIDKGFFFPTVYSDGKANFENYLDKEVDESYYLNEDRTNKMVRDRGLLIPTVDGKRYIGTLYAYASQKYCRQPVPYCRTLKALLADVCLVEVVDNKFRARFLTPEEYFKFMGFRVSDCELLKSKGFSKTNLYRMAGNSIVVDVLERIFEMLFMQYGVIT